MDAETWGGETVAVDCPGCGRVLFKALTQAVTQLLCPCSLWVITSDNYLLYGTKIPAGLESDVDKGLVEQLEAGLGEGG